MSDENLVWETPPSRRTRSEWHERLTPLIDKPGEWARVWEGAVQTARSYTTALRSRRIQVPLPDHAWDFTSRSVDTGNGSDPETVGRVYAVYHGEKAPKN